MKHSIVLAFFASVVSCAGGTETDNPASLQGFTSSTCKSRAPEPGQEALVLASDAEGLQCIEWETNASGSLSVGLLNFPEPCADDYQGTASFTKDGTIELAVHKTSCQVARCGTCVFDFHFELSGVGRSKALPLRTGSAVCATEPTTFDDVVNLPLPQQPSGVTCQYLRRNAVEQYGSARSRCGERNMPCGDCRSADAQTCADGLSCNVVADGDSRCLASCSKNDDCAGGLTSCSDGFCRAGASF
jgi:hypothetical protein